MFARIKIFFEKLDDFINESFFNDYHNWVLWTPVIFGCGIICYFCLEYANFNILYIVLFLVLCITISLRDKKEFFIISVAIFLFSIGYVRTAYYVKSLESPIVKYRMGYVKVYGTIDEVSYYQKDNQTKTRIIVKVDKIEKYKNNLKKDQRENNENSSYFTKDGLMHNVPKFLRININNKKYKAKFGDYVQVKANLIPLPKQVFPGAYNIQREFYFKQIGGIGYNGYVERYFEKINYTLYEKLKNKVYNTRENINNRIINAIGGNTGAVVGSFITGIRGKIASEDINNMTYAGLAHLIAISGLNMTIIMGLAFMGIRRIFVQSEYLALKFNLKKISAFVAIIAGFAYLSITGFPVSANRAYIMSCLYFVAILLDRESDVMRFLCFAAILILFLEPNLILSPSFQLSFFAVIGLVEGFKFLQGRGIKTTTRIIWLKPFYYLFTVFISSIIAEISVTPLAIYYFNIYTPYNMLSNMVAIPLAGFITLPFATLSILLFPFHLEKFLLIPAGWAIDIILKLSEYTVNMPYSIHIISSPSILGLTFIIFGFLWFMLWEQKWRYFGVFLFALGIIFSIFKEMPNVIISPDEELIVLVDKNGDLYFSKKVNEYKTTIIEKKMGEVGHKKLIEYNNQNINQFNKELDYIFKNKDYIDNFRTINGKYKIFREGYKILLI